MKKGRYNLWYVSPYIRMSDLRIYGEHPAYISPFLKGEIYTRGAYTVSGGNQKGGFSVRRQ